MVLDKIVSFKKKALKRLQKEGFLARWKRQAEEVLKDGFRKDRPWRRCSLKGKLSKGKLHLICELKKASPSEGVLRRDFNPLKLARQYERAGASALSVLTEAAFFKGHPATIPLLKHHGVRLPILQKDFILDEHQVYQSFLFGADAILLIAGLLSAKKLKTLTKLAQRFRMEVLGEAHTAGEVEKLLAAGVDMIGLNNRNLKTLKVDLGTAKRLICLVPKGKPIVIESGIESRKQIMAFQKLGARTFLVGTALMRSRDIAKKIRQLRGISNASG